MSIFVPKISESSISERRRARRGPAGRRVIRAARLVGRLSFVVAFVAALAVVVAAVAAPEASAAQVPLAAAPRADSAPGVPRHIAGHVMLGTEKGLRPLAGMRVTLHRVGPDHAGPLDSAFTRHDGGYAFTYRPTGSPDAVYFVSASYGGIAYFSEPTRGESASGDAAAITVFDTTSGPVRIRMAGHHVVVSAPGPDGRREIAEVLDLANDSSVTLVSPDGRKPVWVGHLPSGATNVRVNPSADIAPEAVAFRHDSIVLVAPLSPGMRQLSFVYSLGSDAFPLKIPVEQPTSILEVLAEEPKAKVSAVHLREVAPVAADRRAFRRFLAEDVPGDAVLTIDAPTPDVTRTTYVVILAAVFGVAMLAALAVAFVRRGAARTAAAASAVGDGARAPVPADATAETLLREIATLDARAERAPVLSDEERARYVAEREALKARLATLLAAERRDA